MNRNLARGLTFIAVALFFGIQASTYRLGDLAQAGPGLFPLIVSVIVGVIGLIMVVGSRFRQSELLHFNFKIVAIVMASLLGFAVLTDLVGALVGVMFLVFVSALAAEKYNWKLNVKITLGLMAITYLFSAVLGVGLRLY